MKTLALLALIALSTTAHAESYLCTNGGVERSITVVYLEPGQAVPCEVQYTKDGESQTLWRAQNEGGYCEAQARAFADKQSGWGWHCELTSNTPPDAETIANEEAVIEPAEGADGQ